MFFSGHDAWCLFLHIVAPECCEYLTIILHKFISFLDFCSFVRLSYLLSLCLMLFLALLSCCYFAFKIEVP